MNKVLEWFRQEPVRTVLYPAILAVLGILAARGVVTNEYRDLIVEVLTILVVGVPSVEGVRMQVSPARP